MKILAAVIEPTCKYTRSCVMLNVNKSNSMLFQLSGIQITRGNTLHIGTDLIEHKSNCKLLGIFIDNQLRWNHHISHMSAKLSRSIYQSINQSILYFGPPLRKLIHIIYIVYDAIQFS